MVSSHTLTHSQAVTRRDRWDVVAGGEGAGRGRCPVGGLAQLRRLLFPVQELLQSTTRGSGTFRWRALLVCHILDIQYFY